MVARPEPNFNLPRVQIIINSHIMVDVANGTVRVSAYNLHIEITFNDLEVLVETLKYVQELGKR